MRTIRTSVPDPIFDLLLADAQLKHQTLAAHARSLLTDAVTPSAGLSMPAIPLPMAEPPAKEEWAKLLNWLNKHPEKSYPQEMPRRRSAVMAWARTEGYDG